MPLKTKKWRQQLLIQLLALTCNGPEVPNILIVSTDGTEKLVWTDNEELTNLLGRKTLHDKEKIEFEIADRLTTNVTFYLPANLDKSWNTKYPMLVNV